MTEKLFYTDSHRKCFSAQVLAVYPVEDGYEVVLDRTAFFPTGGGQDADTGRLGETRVLDVKEREGIIYHKTEKSLEVGSEVHGVLDWEARFSKMQQHSGEHIVSGIVHRRFGYDNVGFHMGKDAITMDFNGELTAEELKEIQWEANEVVAQNLEIMQHFPTKEELSSMEYRSKIEIEGQVRIVEIPGVDSCACCAPHVKKTGEIGCIRLLQAQRYKGGARVSMLCGFRALADAQEKADSLRELSMLLSAKEEEVVREVHRLKEELEETKGELLRQQRVFLQMQLEQMEPAACVCHFAEEMQGDGARFFMNGMLEKGSGIVAVFTGSIKSGYRYVIGSKAYDVRPLAKVLNAHFAGRGGGKAEMVQGSLQGEAAEIRKEIEAWRESIGL